MIAPTRAPEADDHDITHLLLAWRQGEGDALEPLIDRVYRQLKGLAATMLRAESHKERFDTTELVHEAFVRLIDIERVEWRDRNHFFAVCARVMRRILVDHARYRLRTKRRAEVVPLTADISDPPCTVRLPELIALDDALRDLADHDPEMAQIVELRFFGGLNRDQIAVVLGISSRTVTRRWRLARAWLTRSLRRTDG